MTSDQDDSDFDFLDEIEQLSRFFTQVTYNFINHTNKTVGGQKIRATDLKKFNEEEWHKYFQDHIENYKLICTDFFKDGFVSVEMKKGKTKKEFVNAFKEFLLNFSSQESDGTEEAVVSNPADNGLLNPECSKDTFDKPAEIDPSFEKISQEPEKREELVADKEITEEGKDLIQNELNKLDEVLSAEDIRDQFEELAKTENEFHGNEKELPISDAEMDSPYHTCKNEIGPEESSESEHVPYTSLTFDLSDLHVDDFQQPYESEKPTDYLSDLWDSLKRPDNLPESNEVHEELIVAGHIKSLDEGFHSGVTDLRSPISAESTLNLDSEADNVLTNLKPLEDSFDEGDEVDPIFEQKRNEQNEAFKNKMAEEKLKREEKQRKFQEELNEIRQQQKLCFAALLTCIQLKHRFEEKEQDVSSWINNCYRKPVLRVLRGFDDFGDTAKEWKYFKKVPEDPVLDARSEIEELHRKVYVLLDTLRTSYDQLEQLSGIAPEALFLEVLQKNICDLAEILNGILDVLEEAQLDNCWYQKLEDSFLSIRPEKIPTTGMLKKICKGANGAGHENLKFPERIVTSSVVIIQEDEEEELSERRKEQNIMECDNPFTDHLHTRNPVQTDFQFDQNAEEIDSSFTEDLEQQTQNTSTPNLNRKQHSDFVFSRSTLSMTP